MPLQNGLFCDSSAAAQGVVLVGSAVVAGNGAPGAVDERDAAGDAIGPVLGDVDGRFPGAVAVDVVAGLDAVDGVAQRVRRGNLGRRG